MDTPAKFTKLSERLPVSIREAKSVIDAAEQKQREVAIAAARWRNYCHWTPLVTLLYLGANALIPALIIIGVAPEDWWIGAIIFWAAQAYQLYAPAVDKRGYPQLFELSAEEVNTRRPLTPWGIFTWKTLGFLSWIVQEGKMRRRMAQAELPMALKDDRVRAIQSLLQQVNTWDQDIRLINRLLDQVELGLIPLSDIAALLAKLQSDEVYLNNRIEYVRRLLAEGPLGTSLGLDRSANDLADQIDDRLTAMREHKEELRRISGTIAARVELSQT